MAEPRRYRFHPLERRGVLLGLQPGQLITVAGGVLAAVAALRAVPGGPGALVAVLVVVTSAVLALWAVAGRPLVAWAPVAVSWSASRRGRVARWGSSCPPVPPGIAVLEAPTLAGEHPLGVISDRRAGTWSAVLPVGGRSFTLLDREDKERRLDMWGALLATAGRSGTPIHRIQWIQRATAGDADALASYLERAGAADPRSGPRTSYQELVAGAAPACRGHEVLVVVSIDPRRAGRGLRAFGGGARAVCGLLRRELRLMEGQLRTAEVRPAAPLDVDRLVHALRLASDPDASRRRRRAKAGAWPMAVQEEWASVRVDGGLYATYWVAEWPRLDVGPDFLAPLLLVGGVRTVSVTMAPVSPAKARREVESARTADLADEELRRRAGFLSTARHRREAEGARHREAELAEGHGEYRFSGYVTVSGTTEDELAGACAAVEQAAQQSHLELRRLYGQQREAFSWTLPLGRGVL
jgi:Putative type VII ESX secretion system translocon, EccE